MADIMEHSKREIDRIISAVLAIEEEEAKSAGAIGYMARMLVQVTIPHSKSELPTFSRKNGKFNLAMMAHPAVGLPYGVYPRLLLAWLVTEAVQKKSSEIILGSSLSQFMAQLGILPTGGRWGTIPRLRDQMKRLFSATVSCLYEDANLDSGANFNIAKEYHLWWNPKQPDQSDIWQSNIILSDEFYKEITERPIPIDMRALEAIKSSSMAVDLYCWLTYRMSYLKRPVEIPWLLLQQQFGANYADDKSGRYAFKSKLKTQLKKVLAIYMDAKVEEGNCGLILKPSKTHIIK